MEKEIDVMEELKEERQENERLTIEEVKKLDELIKSTSNEITRDSAALLIISLLLVCAGQLFSEILKYGFIGGALGFATYNFFKDILPLIRKNKENKKRKEEKEEEIELLRR